MDRKVKRPSPVERRDSMNALERGSDGKPIAEFGNPNTMNIPRNVIAILPQIRRQFDPVKLQELADSMPLSEDADGLIHELMEPVAEGVHTEESALRYLEQYNRANQDNARVYTLEDLPQWQTPAGIRYVIHIAGERRIRAADILIEKHGYSAESLMRSSVYEDIEYVDALPLQFIENNARVNPSRPDEARAMRGYIDFMREIDPSYTQKQCAEKFAVSPDRVHDAIVFTNYPPSMQAMERHYPFSWVIGVEEIYKTWLAYYQTSASGVFDPMEMGLLGLSDEVRLAAPKSDGLGMWTTSDGRALFESAEDAAAHEAELCFMKIKAEQLARRAALRKNEARRLSDVRFPAQLKLIKQMMRDEASGVGQDAMLGVDDAASEDLSVHRHSVDGESHVLSLFETYGARRRIASTALFEATVQSLWLLEARGDLSDSMRERLAQYALLDDTSDQKMPDISETDELLSIAS